MRVAKPGAFANGELPLISQRPSELIDGVVRGASENGNAGGVITRPACRSTRTSCLL